MGDYIGGVIWGDTRSLDYSSSGFHSACSTLEHMW